MRHLSISIVLLLGSLLVGTAYGRASTKPIAKEGVLDLRNWNPEKGELIKMDGQWEFYWEQFVDPEDFGNPELSNPNYIQVPGSWSIIDKYPQNGYATYRLRVLFPQKQQVSLHFSGLWSASKVFLDGKMVAESGRISAVDDPKYYTPLVRDSFFTFIPQNDEFEIVVQTANYDIFLGGIASASPRIGSSTAMGQHRELFTSQNYFLIGCLFIMGVYHLCLWSLRVKAKSPLYFGLFCLATMVYVGSGSGASVVRILVPDIGYNAAIRLFNMWILCPVLFGWFIYDLFPKHFSKRFAQGQTILILPLVVHVLTGEPRDFVWKTLLVQFVTLVFSIYFVYVMVRAIRDRVEGARLFLTGSLILVATSIHDMAMARGMFESITLGGLGTFLFIFVQSLLLARRFSNAFRAVAISEKKIRGLSDALRQERDHVLSLNENLESIVDEKTRDIRSIMTHIQLGIYAITNNGRKVHKDYSEHLKEIFEIDDLTDVDGCDLIFSNSNMSSDEISQAVSSIDISLGDADFLWDTNSHCLPREIKRKRHDGSWRILDISWNPIADENDMIDKILVTVRDVTELRALVDDANNKKEELEFIGELLNVPAEDFRRFINSCEYFIVENRKLINSGSIKARDMEVLKVLFINMHTMKGAARSLYFKKMTQIFHDVEQYYAVLQKNPSTIWDVDKMNKDIDEVERIVMSYAHLNEHKLGRSSSIGKSIELPEEMALWVFRNIQSQSTHSTDLSKVSQFIFQNLFSPIKDVLEDTCKCLPTLAKDLEKLPPEVVIETQDLNLSSHGDELLRKVFVHILRNTMDHGIEKPIDRVKKGKAETGLITITVERKKIGVEMNYHDDGRGLDIATILDIALKRQWIKDKSEVNLQEAAELIFHSGLSTSSTINDISGRGVGMDAVRSFLRKAGGDIQIHIIDEKHPKSGCYPFSFSIILPENLFASQGGMTTVGAAS